MADTPIAPPAGDRLAKIIARSGLCSRRDAELWIKDGRVAVNGKTIRTPAFNVTDRDVIKVDGAPLAARQGTRVWLYHKPAGLVVTEKDPEGRETIFEKLEQNGLPRVVTIGRLDINTEGLLLLTNDGGLKRVLELPATGWLRKYRVRAFGSITQQQLDALKNGIEVDGVKYGSIEATLERPQGSNVWLLVALREGKNREIKNVLAALGLQVNRLIRVSFGPFQLGDLPIGGVEVVKARVLRDQLGKRLAQEANVDFDSELPNMDIEHTRARIAANPKVRAAAPGKDLPQQRATNSAAGHRFRFTDRADKSPRDIPDEERPRKDRPGRFDSKPSFRRRDEPEGETAPPRKIHFDDGSEAAFELKTYGKKPGRGKPSETQRGAKFGGAKDADASRSPRTFADKPKRDFGDKPKRDFGDKPRGPRSFDDKPKRDFSDRPKRDFSDKPRAARPAADGPRPARSFADKPKRDYGDKPRAPRSFDDKPKRDFSARPKRDATDKPRAARSAGDGPRPARSFAGKPGGKTFTDKPRSPRPTGGAARVARAKPPGKSRPKPTRA